MAWGYEPVVVRDGREAWAALERPDGPRLASLDGEMPLLEGPEVCRRARAPPSVAMRRWMDLFGDWIATKNGMLDTLPAMIETGEIAHGQTRVELLEAITTILGAGRAVDEIRDDVTAEDIAASLTGIFTVAPKPQRGALAGRLLDLLMDGLGPTAIFREVGQELGLQERPFSDSLGYCAEPAQMGVLGAADSLRAPIVRIASADATSRLRFRERLGEELGQPLCHYGGV